MGLRCENWASKSCLSVFRSTSKGGRDQRHGQAGRMREEYRKEKSKKLKKEGQEAVSVSSYVSFLKLVILSSTGSLS